MDANRRDTSAVTMEHAPMTSIDADRPNSSVRGVTGRPHWKEAGRTRRDRRLDILDTQYQEYTIDRVKPEDDGYEISADGWTVWCPSKEIMPHVGDIIRLYGRGIGHFIRGIAINDQIVFHRTEDEDRLYHANIGSEHARKRRAETMTKLPQLETDYLNLPTSFRARIARFRRVNGEFDVDFLAYELFVCQEAVKIADYCLVAVKVKEFHDWPYERQKPVISDQHSGNTFGAACNLAYAYLTNPAILEEMHGALCPLDGCERYGCYAATHALIA